MPLVEPRSVMRMPWGVGSILAWCLETSGSSRTSALSGARPIVPAALMRKAWIVWRRMGARMRSTSSPDEGAESAESAGAPALGAEGTPRSVSALCLWEESPAAAGASADGAEGSVPEVPTGSPAPPRRPGSSSGRSGWFSAGAGWAGPGTQVLPEALAACGAGIPCGPG